MCGEAIKDMFISDITPMKNLHFHLLIKFFNSTFLISSHILHIPQ